MTLQTKISYFADYVQQQIQAACDSQTLPFEGVYYGDQDKIPTTPIVCIEPDDKSNVLNGVPRKTLTTVGLYLIVYVDKVQSPQLNRKESDEIVEQLEDFLHADPTMGGAAIHSLVDRIESGSSNKGNTIYRAARITFSITTQQFLPLATP
jgi:hypothetical protein